MTNQNAPILFLPSESSTKYHLLQLYLFMMIWTYSETNLEPNDRRRKIMDCHNIPILSDMDLTPESIDPHKSLQLQDVHPTAAA